MAKRVIYQLPNDNVARNATITATAEDPTYLASYIADGKYTRPAKLTSFSGAWTFAYAAKQIVQLVALGPNNLDPGLSVRIQGNNTDVWTSPTFSQLITIPARENDDPRTLPFLELPGLANYDATGFFFWRLYIEGANSANPAIGEVWLGSTIRTFDRNYAWSYEVTDERRFIEHETEYGQVSSYDLQVRQRRLLGVVRASEQGLVDLRSLHRAMRGRVNYSLFIPDASVNDAWWFRWTRDFRAISLITDAHDVELNLEELSQGLPL